MNEKLLKNINRQNIAGILFYLGVLLELLVSFTGYLIGGYRESLIIVAAMGLFSLSILLDMDIKRDFLILLAGSVYGIICYYFQHSAFVLRIFLAIMAGRRQNAKTVFKMFFFGTVAGMLYFGILSALGQHNDIYVEAIFRSEVERRYTFGFFHPNGYSLFLFRVAVMGLFVYIDKLKIPVYIACSVICSLLMYPCKSKIGLFIMLITFILFGLYKFKLNKVAISLSVLSTIGVAILWLYIRFQSYIIREGVIHDLWMFVDKVTTGRSGASFRAMNNNKATWFGVGFGPQTSEMGIVDSIYCQGIIFMILFIVTVIWLYIKMIKSGNVTSVIVIAVTVMYSVAESFLQYFNKNMIWMLCIGVLFAINEKKIEDSDVKENN